MTRLVSGLALAVAALAAILYLPTVALRVLACVVAALAAHEFLRIRGGIRGVRRWLVIGLVAVMVWFASQQGMVAVIVLAGWCAIEVISMLSRDESRWDALVTDVLPLLYIGAPLGLLVGLHAEYGWTATLLLIAAIAVSDSAQYYTGRAFGRRPLAPTISPKKTVEGAVGGVVIGTAFMAGAGSRVLPSIPLVALTALGFVVVLLGIAGDLFESKLKREAGVKDSSALIPGHGGVLDRIDALLFATPAFYFAVRSLT